MLLKAKHYLGVPIGKICEYSEINGIGGPHIDLKTWNEQIDKRK